MIEANKNKKGNVSKKDIVSEISNETGIVENNISDIVGDLVDFLSTNLSEGKNIKITNFASFKIYKRKAKKGRNPLTKQEYDIPPSYSIKFIQSSGLKK